MELDRKLTNYITEK